MRSKLYRVIFFLAFMCTSYSTEDQNFWPPDGNWKHSKMLPRCKIIKPTPRDIVRRIYAILPYFDKDHQNTQFLHKYRRTMNKLSESEEGVEREAAFYAAVVTPILFLQQHRDARCLLERFERALQQFQTCSPSQKRSSLNYLQNLRDLSFKVHFFVDSLPVKRASTHTPELEVTEKMRDPKDIRFLKELIKSLG